MQANTYKSEVDRWMIVSTMAATAGFLAGLVIVMLYGGVLERIFVSLLLVAGAAFPWWILATTEYTVTDHTLVIRSGPFHWDVPLREIVSVTKTNSPASSPALSLDRLRIDRSGGAPIMISPENRRRFLEDLRSRGTVGTTTV